jgi:tetraacyldisaccharide-1-P 4'-kinase
VTTLKDWMRLPPEWRDRVNVLQVSMSFEAEAEQLIMNMVDDIVEIKRS